MDAAPSVAPPMDRVQAPAGKDRLTSLDTLAVSREVRALTGGHLDKAFDLPGGGVSLVFRSAARGRSELVLVPGRYAALLAERPDHAEELSPIARELRRLLSGARLTEVPDPAGERQLVLRFARGDVPEPLALVVELFGTGNLLVVRGDRLVAVASPKTWAHRAVRVGAEYRPPPSRGNPFLLSASEVAAALLASRTDRTSTLAARLSLGGPVAEELLARAGLEGPVAAPTDAAEAGRRLRSALDQLLVEVGEVPRGFLYRRDGVLVDVEPYPSERWRATPGVVEESTATFSEGAARFFAEVGAVAPPPRAEDTARQELERQLARQRVAVSALEEEAARLLQKGHAIYVHYAAAEEAVERARREGTAPDGVVEATLGEDVVPLRVDASLTANAQSLYDLAKRAQAKLAGARTAAAETEARLTTSRPPPAAATASTSGPSSPSERRRRAPQWFERYRWFLSSEGILVIGGRDAATNDLVVRRYLKPKDLYVHAEIHGAPSVIVKHPPEADRPIGEATMREAAAWGVCFSKAWRAGLASADAFWVTADQVSKAGASGEFVARGAWVIHGTKHLFRDLPTELAVGTIDVQGEEKWMVAPPSAWREPARVRVVLTPADERDRPARETELARELGVSRSLLQSILPAGGIAVRRA